MEAIKWEGGEKVKLFALEKNAENRKMDN